MALWSGDVQDSWKTTAKLTLNLGVRYDYLPAIHMLNDRLANGFDIPHARYIIQNNVPACTTTFTNPCIPGGVGSVSHSSNIVFANGMQQVGAPIKDNVGPRLGFAYQTFNKMVVNGGVGILYDTITARSQWVQNNIEGPTWPWTTGISAQQVNFSQNGTWPDDDRKLDGGVRDDAGEHAARVAVRGEDHILITGMSVDRNAAAPHSCVRTTRTGVESGH